MAEKTIVTILKLFFWGIVAYLFYQKLGLNGLLGLIAVWLAVNIIILNKE